MFYWQIPILYTFLCLIHYHFSEFHKELFAIFG